MHEGIPVECSITPTLFILIWAQISRWLVVLTRVLHHTFFSFTPARCLPPPRGPMFPIWPRKTEVVGFTLFGWFQAKAPDVAAATYENYASDSVRPPHRTGRRHLPLTFDDP